MQNPIFNFKKAMSMVGMFFCFALLLSLYSCTQNDNIVEPVVETVLVDETSMTDDLDSHLKNRGRVLSCAQKCDLFYGGCADSPVAGNADLYAYYLCQCVEGNAPCTYTVDGIKQNIGKYTCEALLDIYTNTVENCQSSYTTCIWQCEHPDETPGGDFLCDPPCGAGEQCINGNCEPI